MRRWRTRDAIEAVLEDGRVITSNRRLYRPETLVTGSRLRVIDPRAAQ
jgi:hypothetical protein